MRVDDAVVDVLAVHRLTRLVTSDFVTRPLRDRVILWAYERDVDQRASRWLEAKRDLRQGDCTAVRDLVEEDECPPKTAKLVTCNWCAGMWVAGGVVVLRALVPGVWGPVARVLAMSSVVGLITEAEGT